MLTAFSPFCAHIRLSMPVRRTMSSADMAGTCLIAPRSSNSAFVTTRLPVTVATDEMPTSNGRRSVNCCGRCSVPVVVLRVSTGVPHCS